jgi:hypothetical protein
MACVIIVFFYEKRVILKLRRGRKAPGREREREVQGHIETSAEFEQENLQSKPEWCLAPDARL